MKKQYGHNWQYFGQIGKVCQQFGGIGAGKNWEAVGGEEKNGPITLSTSSTVSIFVLN